MTNNKQQTGVEYLVEQLFPKALSVEQHYHIEKAKEIEKEQSQAYAAFCVACDRKKLPLLEFEGWIKLEGGNK
jgi:hypothetical protein